LLSWVALACGDRSGAAVHGEQSHGHANIGGQVISTVHGFAITVAEVEALAREAGLPAAQALERLQAERLLMAEAERRGFGDDPAVREVGRKAAVQALLDQVANSEQVSEADVKEAYAKAKERFDKPERRASVHVLAALGKQPTPEAEAAAKAYAAQILPRLAAAEDPSALARELNGQRMNGFGVTAEVLRPFDRNAPVEKEYLDAMFALTQPGVAPEPVRTSYGWHAIRVTQIVPAELTPYEAAAPQLRAELKRALERRLVDQWLERARKQQRPQQSADATKALAALPP
jgi:hypothetical protein